MGCGTNDHGESKYILVKDEKIPDPNSQKKSNSVDQQQSSANGHLGSPEKSLTSQQANQITHLIGNPASFSQIIFDSIDRKKVDKKLDKFPKKLPDIIKFIKDAGFNNEEKAWVIYKWIATTISIDVEKYFRKEKIEYNPEIIFKNYLALSEGYAFLFNYFCKELGLSCEIINGWIKDDDYDPQVKLVSISNHSWNVIQLKEKWFIIDCMQGSGKIINKRFKEKFDSLYFCADPLFFIKKAFPVDQKWQMLNSSVISKDFFEQSLKYENEFYACGVTKIVPDKAVISIKKQAIIQINYDPNISPFISADLYTVGKEDEEVREVKNSTFVQLYLDSYDVRVVMKFPGIFRLNIYGSLDEKKKGDLLFYYIVKCVEPAGEDAGFPRKKKYYDEMGAVLEEPLNCDLKKNSTVKFKISIDDVEYVKVRIGNQITNLISKANDGNFEGDVLIVEGWTAEILSKEKNDPEKELLSYDIIN